MVRPINARIWGGPSGRSDMGWSARWVFGYGVVFPRSHMGWSVLKAFGYGVVRTANVQHAIPHSTPLGRTTTVLDQLPPIVGTPGVLLHR